MAYCTLEEAWGQNYKSFLSPASLTPDWLSKCKEMEKVKGPSGENSSSKFKSSDKGEVIERFDGKIRKDDDLLIDYDEFNLPLYFDSPKGVDSLSDDYYRLIDNQYQENFENTPNESYAEEDQFNDSYTRECDQSFPSHVKFHLKKCRNCRARVRQWLDQLEDGVMNGVDSANDIGGVASRAIDGLNNGVAQPVKSGIKSLFPREYGGYIDLIFFIAVGIFIIFVLDAFVRLGSTFSRR